MAIVFTTPIPTDRFLFSEENRIVEFSTDSGTQPLYCDINIDVFASLRIYPLPNGTFWVNLKEYISPLLRQYEDNINPTTIDPLDIDTFVFDWSQIFLDYSIDFTLQLIDDTQETASVAPYILLGAEQLIKFKKGETLTANNSFVLSALKKQTANTHHLRYWDGFPFDFALTREIPTINDSQTITNLTNGITSDPIELPYDVNRIFLSDGDTTITLEDYLPLVSGYNKLSLENGIYIDLWKHQNDCGVYVKWLNNFGGYNYWLFNPHEEIQKNIRSRGTINNDFENLDSTVNQFKSLGKTSVNTHTVLADYLTVDDVELLSSLTTSPQVYLFAGVQYSRNSFDNWIGIEVTNTRQTLRNPSEPNNEFLLQFTMPQDYNIML